MRAIEDPQRHRTATAGLATRARARALDPGKTVQALYPEPVGPSGFEGPVREIIVRELRALGVETSTDGLGSVIGVLAGSSERPRIMLAAHMDEVGAIVRYVTPEGMVKFQPVGGWLDQASGRSAMDHHDEQRS